MTHGIWKNVLSILLLAVGIGAFLYPEILTGVFRFENKKLIAAFDQAGEQDAAFSDGTDGAISMAGGPEAGESGDGDLGIADTVGTVYVSDSGQKIVSASELLWESIQDYNERICETGQAEFCDAWSATQPPASIEGLAGAVFGYIEIPSMDAELPLYVGASAENLAKGAAILGETSLPVGGENTNSVIAAHRGYRGIPFFREIEKLSAGDAVYITNPWGTLGYRVESVDIISPADSEKMKIREGRDMVTLITCHPYRSHGKYRYIVLCVRDDSVLGGDAEPSGAAAVSSGTGTGNVIAASDGMSYETSQPDINAERGFRYACGAGLIIFFILCLRSGRHGKREKGQVINE